LYRLKPANQTPTGPNGLLSNATRWTRTSNLRFRKPKEAQWAILAQAFAKYRRAKNMPAYFGVIIGAKCGFLIR